MRITNLNPHSFVLNTMVFFNKKSTNFNSLVLLENLPRYQTKDAIVAPSAFLRLPFRTTPHDQAWPKLSMAFIYFPLQINLQLP